MDLEQQNPKKGVRKKFYPKQWEVLRLNFVSKNMSYKLDFRPKPGTHIPYKNVVSTPWDCQVLSEDHQLFLITFRVYLVR